MAIELNQIWDFPIKEFHPFPRALLGVGAHDIIGGVEARNLGFKRTLLMTTGLRGSGIIEELTGKIEYQASRSCSTTRWSPTPPRTTTSWRRPRSTSRKSATASSPSAAAPATTPPRVPAW